MRNPQEVGFPFALDGSGRVDSPDYNQHVEQLIEQVLLTMPGERVNRPTFGSGLPQTVFEPDDVVASTAKMLVQTALDRWLPNRIKVISVDVSWQQETLTIVVDYIVLATGARQISTYTK